MPVRAALLTVGLLALASCRSSHGTRPAAAPIADRGSAAPAAAASASATAAATAQQLWARYQAAHAGATTANAIARGRVIWALLAPDARSMVSAVAQDMIGRLDARSPITAQDLGYKLLGETAAARAADMASARLLAVTPEQADHAKLEIELGQDRLTFEAVHDASGWRFASTPSLVASYDTVFKAPAGGLAPRGSATLEELSARWQDVLAHGNGWDAYNMLSAANRARLDTLIGRMGGSGAADVVKVLEKTIADRREAGITVTKATLEDRTAASASIVLEYSNGRNDRFPAVLAGGTWWLEMPI